MSALSDAKRKFTSTTPANFANTASRVGVISEFCETSGSSGIKNNWPYPRAEDEPRCLACRHWWQKEAVWLPTHEVFGDCRRHEFETLERDNCKHHDPQQGSGLRGRTL